MNDIMNLRMGKDISYHADFGCSFLVRSKDNNNYELMASAIDTKRGIAHTQSPF